MNDSSREGNFDKPVSYAKGSVLTVEGEPANYLFLVKSGVIRTMKDDGHRLTPVGIIRERGFVGELSVFSDSSSMINAIAIENTEVYMIKKSDIKKVLSKCPDWISSIMGTITERLKLSVDMLIEHRIVDDLYEQNLEISIQEEKKFKKSIDDYRSRRGLKS